MSNCSSKPIFDFKRGDDLKLDFTVQDTNNDDAVSQLEVITAQKTILEELENADPVDTAAVAAQLVVVETAEAYYEDLIRVDITGWTIKSAVDRSGKAILDLTVTLTDSTNGTFTISADAVDTETWPIAPLDCDVEFIRPQGKVSSETFTINVKRDVTR